MQPDSLSRQPTTAPLLTTLRRSDSFLRRTYKVMWAGQNAQWAGNFPKEILSAQSKKAFLTFSFLGLLLDIPEHHRNC